MTLDSSLLTEKELFHKITRMVEHTSNTKIKLTYNKGQNCCSKYDERNFIINIATPSIKHITKYTALIHELSHILFRSPFKEIKELLETWDSKKYKLYFQAYNVLEDQRIESHITSMYLAYKKRFKSTLTRLGKDMGKHVDNLEHPVNILLAIRFNNEELVKDIPNFEHYKKALQDVENTDVFGALRILISIKKYIDEYDFNELDDPMEMNEVDYNDNTDSIPDEKKNFNEAETNIEQIKEIGKENGMKEINNIRSKMTNTHERVSHRSIIIRESKNKSPYRINKKLSAKITNIMSMLKLKYKYVISDVGFDIDIDSYINNKMNGLDLNNSFIDENVNRGFSIVLSVDGSMSMIVDDNISKARNFVATFFDALKGMNNVELRANVWSSSKFGAVWVRDISKLSDSNNITLDDKYANTPTHIGLKYSQDSMLEMKGKNRIVFFITDGLPLYKVGGRQLDNTQYMNMCKKAHRNLLKYTPNVFCILIQRSGYFNTPKPMVDLFGNKIIRVKNVDHATEKIIKQLRRIIQVYVNK